MARALLPTLLVMLALAAAAVPTAMRMSVSRSAGGGTSSAFPPPDDVGRIGHTVSLMPIQSVLSPYSSPCKRSTVLTAPGHSCGPSEAPSVESAGERRAHYLDWPGARRGGQAAAVPIACAAAVRWCRCGTIASFKGMVMDAPRMLGAANASMATSALSVSSRS